MFDVDLVLSDLSLKEKIDLLSVPSIRFSDGPNGIRGTRFFAGVPAACIPCGTALGATWDRQLLFEAGELMALECKAKGAHSWLGPTINIQRSPLGGRGFESYSEDPCLSGVLASSIIRGCESLGIQSVVKHFVCNDQEDERRAVDTIVTPRALREIYLKPFQIVAQNARPGGLMTSYNKVNGVHCSQDHSLLQTVVRDEWGWDPLVVSDWFGTYSTDSALNAGLDLEMPGKTRYRGALVEFAVGARLVSEHIINKRARRVLEFVKRAASVQVSPSESSRDLPEDRQLNRKLAGQGIVLLKNDDKILPLKPKANSTIAVIGSSAKYPAISGGGSASLDPYYTTNVLQALTCRLEPSVKVEYQIGVYAQKMLPVLAESISNSDGSTGGIISFYNEPHGTDRPRERICHEPLRQLFFQLMDYNRNPKLNYELFYATVETTFTPSSSAEWEFGLTVCGTADLYVDDELVIENTTDQVGGEAFFKKGTIEKLGRIRLNKGKSYKIRIEFGSAKTSKLMAVGVVSFGGGGARLGARPVMSVDQSIEDAVKLASRCDHVIVCTGLNGDWESEGFDRKHMDLPPKVDELVARVLEVNKKAIVVNQSVNVRDNPSFMNFGASGGRVLYGEDIHVGYRGYDLTETEPLFCFGHGLSYCEFNLANLVVEDYKISFDASNIGPQAGRAVPQVYIAKNTTGLSFSPKELVAFENILLESGQTQKVSHTLDRNATSFWSEVENAWVEEAGDYTILVGLSSKNILLEGRLRVSQRTTWLGL
ncbi:hypothetical protein F66182_4154 [Fusarium sp. NRRL 66182]|nr:hypothetical protein F66182_4154 [Fusarium sp. NRRL 66182]